MPLLDSTRPRPDAATWRTALVLGAALTLLSLATPSTLAEQPLAEPRAMPTRLAGAWKGDFDGMVERRTVRFAVPYSRTLYSNDKGRERGITADFVRDFERYLNQRYRTELGKRPITVVIRPTTRDVLLKDVVDGLADIAAGNLTATEARL